MEHWLWWCQCTLIVLQKLTNSTRRYPVPRFKQKIEIQGASYSIMRQQFPLQLAYGVTVHRIQGCTIQKAIVCLNSKFESGQAYVALARVTKLEDLVLWDFCINLLQFYRQLLAWCDYVDEINPNPIKDVVAYPPSWKHIVFKPMYNRPISDPVPVTSILSASIRLRSMIIWGRLSSVEPTPHTLIQLHGSKTHDTQYTHIIH